ncbi:hypothetical protein D3C87_1424130 [compost metagenome]
MGRTATEGHHEITAAFLEQSQAKLDVGDARVRLGAVKDHRVDVQHRQLLGNHLRHAGLGQPGVGDDQRLAKAVFANGDHGFVEAVDAHDVHGGDEKRAAHERISNLGPNRRADPAGAHRIGPSVAQ